MFPLDFWHWWFGKIVKLALHISTNVYSIYIVGPLPDALNNASTGYPVMNLVDDATGHIGSGFFSAIIIICFMAGAIASLAAASRQLWAFARNGGVPFSRFFAPVDTLSFLSFPHRLTRAGTSSIRYSSQCNYFLSGYTCHNCPSQHRQCQCTRNHSLYL